jgi:hypothetical protein
MERIMDTRLTGEGRTTKEGRVIKAEVKSYRVAVKEDLVTGILNLKGEGSKFFANVTPKKVLPVGHRTSLRIAYKKFNGNTLVYVHGFGWAEVESMDVFDKEIKDDIYDIMFDELSATEKIKYMKKFVPEKFEALTKTEQMLLAFIDGQDLVEAEKEIQVDKSLKYKIKKHPETYEEAFLKKLTIA